MDYGTVGDPQLQNSSRRVPVVAAALVVAGRVLAAHRRRPAGWEFPGGKVEPGESPAAAIERECREELGIGVRAIRLLGSAIDARIELSLWKVALEDGAPVAGADHDELRWLSAAELDSLDWLSIDRKLLAFTRGVSD
jgi:8-oxo-dGTP diphosphatase